MIMKTTPAELITPEEAAELSHRFSTVGEVYRAREVFEEFMKLTTDEQDYNARFLWALASVYIAGRIQGIREERAKR
ncbi:MAG: hypothetical protein J6X85_02995 [Ruminococcus sp.]|nr:hypothetical protein [Ruminococcus sp.]